MKKCFYGLTLLICLASFLFGGKMVNASTADHVAISEVQIAGATADDEFIEIYNPTTSSIDFETLPLKLHIRNSNGTDQNRALTFFNKTILPHGYFLIGPSSGYTGNISLDATYSATSGNKLVPNGGIYISKSTTADTDIIDKVGWGSQPTPGYEDSPWPEPLISNQSIERRPGGEDGNGEDTDNNYDDFSPQSIPNPENSSSPPRPTIEIPPPADTTPPEDITNLATTVGDGIVNLSWTASVNSYGDLTDQILYQSTDGGTTFDSGTSLGPTAITYQLSNLTNGTTYALKITTRDNATPPNESVGITISATPQTETPPTEPPAEINPGEVVINEFVYDPAEEEKEWLELYNKTASPIDLTGWIIEDGTGEIISLTETIAASSFIVKELSSNKLNNDGDIIILKSPAGVIIDQVAYDDWDDGDKTNNAPPASNANSLARYPNGADTDVDNIDWQNSSAPTKGTANQISIIIPPPVQSGGSSISINYNPGDLVINELVSDPADGGTEWIEVYNNTGSSISLFDWKIEDGAEDITELAGDIAAYGFFVFKNPKGLLNNAGDKIILKYQDKIIDEMTYGDWDDGEEGDNAPMAKDPASLARVKDGQDSNNDYRDFAITEKPTPGAANILEDSPAYLESSVVITEFCPNPEGADNENEFIEIGNFGTAPVDLTGWILADASSKKYVIKKEDLPADLGPGQYLAFYRRATGIALNNSGKEEVKLFDPTERLVSSVTYSGKAAENEAYARDENKKWFWTKTPTPSQANEFVSSNQKPLAVINAPTEVLVGELIAFDASDSSDPENGDLKYLWDFGDGQTSAEMSPLYFYNAPGQYKISLTATDPEKQTGQTSILITVAGDGGVGGPEEFIDDYLGLSQSIIINEFSPNPAGSDSAEFIELKNIGATAINLAGWSIDDEEGGSKPYVFKNETIIGPGGFFVLKKSESKLSLNNDADSVRSLNPVGGLMESISYESAVEGASYSRKNNDWLWTTETTPGEENILNVFVKKAVATGSQNKKFKPTLNVELEKIREQDVGDRVKVKGIVAVLPGILGQQIFYLAGSGVQIYMYNKDFPNLQIGDFIEVAGELSESGGEARIKIQDKSDITILEQREPPQPHPLKIGEIGEETEGFLATIEGEVIEKRGSSVFIDDGSDEALIYIKDTTGIDKNIFAEGVRAKITGIISQTKTGYRLLPRSDTDIEILENTAKDKLSETKILETTTKGQNTLKYLNVATMALVVVLGGMVMRLKKEVKK
ncbi:MAG: lamin tail domain-containing protein [Patescibacteria group bacterium]|nr:lamin tail domain-containing protein [Patescibacteria group bacterium]MDD5490926.1 lamin tail domain-containing protein [Patescibacteria group bacterium]